MANDPAFDLRRRARVALGETSCVALARYLVADALCLGRPLDQDMLETLERAAAGLAGAAPPAPTAELVSAPAGPRFVRLTQRYSGAPVAVNACTVQAVAPRVIEGPGEGDGAERVRIECTDLTISGQDGYQVVESFDAVLALLSGAEPGAER